MATPVTNSTVLERSHATFQGTKHDYELWTVDENLQQLTKVSGNAVSITHACADVLNESLPSNKAGYNLLWFPVETEE